MRLTGVSINSQNKNVKPIVIIPKTIPALARPAWTGFFIPITPKIRAKIPNTYDKIGKKNIITPMNPNTNAVTAGIFP